MNKKRYAGLLWTKPEKYDKMDSKVCVWSAALAGGSLCAPPRLLFCVCRARARMQRALPFIMRTLQTKARAHTKKTPHTSQPPPPHTCPHPRTTTHRTHARTHARQQGIETVRRDNCQLVRNVVETVLDHILVHRDEQAAIAYVKVCVCLRVCRGVRCVCCVCAVCVLCAPLCAVLRWGLHVSALERRRARLPPTTTRALPGKKNSSVPHLTPPPPQSVISDLLQNKVDMSLLVVTKALAQDAEDYKVCVCVRACVWVGVRVCAGTSASRACFCVSVCVCAEGGQARSMRKP